MDEKQIYSYIEKAIQELRESDPQYARLVTQADLLILGPGSPFDSIAFTSIAVYLEEQIEEVAGSEFIVQADVLLDGATQLSLAQMASRISQLLLGAGQGKQ